MSQQIRQLVFQGTHSQAMLACHLIAVGLAVFLMIVISRHELKLVSRYLGLGLLTLRLAVLAVVLLTLLQPTLTWTFEQEQAGRIRVGIDVSDSMRTIDRHASPAEKLRLARGLELIGNAGNEDRLNRWQKSLDSDLEPEWVDVDEAKDEVERAALANSRRDSLKSIFSEVEKLARNEIVQRLLLSTQDPLLDQLKQLNRIELFVFAGTVETVERDQLAKTVSEPSASLATENTDLSLGLLPGINGHGEVTATILFTDGRDHSHQNLSAIAASLKAVNSPVYPVLIGSSYRPKDLSIQLLEHPQSVYKGDHPQLKVTLGTVGFEGKIIEVELVSDEEANGEPLRQSVKCVGKSATVEFSLDADTIGRRSYTVQTPVLEGETHDDNNSRSFSLNVVDDRAKVLLAEGEARWEFRYLDNALARDDRIELTHVLFEQPFLGVLEEPFFPRELKIPAGRPDALESAFSDFDLIVIGDVSPNQVTDAVWQQILKFVSEGGTLVLSAGKRDMPNAHRSAALDQLLPISNPIGISLADASQEATPRLRGLPLQLNADGEQQPMLQFAPDLAQNIAIWKGLPGQMWAMLGEAKPSATVWATTLIPAGRVDGLGLDRKFAVMIHQYIGSGQVLWLGIDGTWRWRSRVGDKYHHRFWAQLARWAATNKMSAGTDFVRFGLDKDDLDQGQPALVRARWTQAYLTKFPKLKSLANVYRKQNQNVTPFTTIELKPVKNQPLQHEGVIMSLPAGEYVFRLAANDAELGEKTIETTLFVHEKPSVELSDVSTNRDLLAQIAEASGGRLFLPDELHELPKLFRKVDEKIAEYHEVTLWDHWPWLVILFSLLMAEWVLRKLNGLP